jgi:hypothetical protein
MGNSSYVRTGLCPGFVGSSGKSLGLKLRARLPLYSRPSESVNSRKPVSNPANPCALGLGQSPIYAPLGIERFH